MGVLATIWKWCSGLVVGLFVAAYVAALLVHNTCNLVGEGSRIDRASDYALSATGTTQRWNMFAPNVGTLSYSPIVVLVFRDGRRVALHSEVEPDLPLWGESRPIPNEVKGDARNYDWRFHLGDGRIRKFESRVASYQDQWWRVRTTYARWRAAKWLAENPGKRTHLLRIELWRCKIRHPGYGSVLQCETVEVLPLRPHADVPLWPVRIDPTYPPYWS
jgi:hypothetical protein